MKRRETAAELLARLQEDPEYRARIAQRDARLAESERFRQKEEAGLVSELRAAGFEVESAWDFINISDPYFEALPILVKHLEKSYTSKTKDGIVRALTVKAEPDLLVPALLKAFRRETDPDLRWVMGNALGVALTEPYYDEALELFEDSSWGGSRDMLAHAIARIGGQEAAKKLIPQLADPDVATETIVALGNLRAEEAREPIEKFLAHDDSWVRQKAKAAIKKLDTALRRKKRKT